MRYDQLILELDRYTDTGLYMIIEGFLIKLTDKVIKETAEDFWNDKSKIPDSVKKNVKFQRCPSCPVKEGMCDTLKAILPFLDCIDRYQSFDEVTAIYKSDDVNRYYVDRTTMQEALKYSTILALTRYCRFGEEYSYYFRGVIPTSSPEEIAEKVYLNAFFLHRGDVGEVNDFIAAMYKGWNEAIGRLLDRAALLCRNDTFLNAFVGTQAVTEFLSADMMGTIDRKIAPD